MGSVCCAAGAASGASALRSKPMLPSGRRLNKVLFEDVRKSSHKVDDLFGSLKFRGSSPPGALSVVVPKSLVKSAVKRNALRRALYAALEGVSVPLQGIFYLKKDGLPEEVSKKLRKLVGVAEKTLMERASKGPTAPRGG